MSRSASAERTRRKCRRSSPARSPWTSRGEVALLQQDHAQTAAGSVARNADAVQPAADDREIVIRHAQRLTQRTEVHHF